MQRIAQIAWKKDGARQAQVEFHCPVPKVTPAATRAPTLILSVTVWRGRSLRLTSKSFAEWRHPMVARSLRKSR